MNDVAILEKLREVSKMCKEEGITLFAVLETPSLDNNYQMILYGSVAMTLDMIEKSMDSVISELES